MLDPACSSSGGEEFYFGSVDVRKMQQLPFIFFFSVGIGSKKQARANRLQSKSLWSTHLKKERF